MSHSKRKDNSTTSTTTTEKIAVDNQQQQIKLASIDVNSFNNNPTMTMTARNSTEIQKNRLVFGLNARANKTKYDQYAEQRSLQESTTPLIASSDTTNKLTSQITDLNNANANKTRDQTSRSSSATTIGVVEDSKPKPLRSRSKERKLKKSISTSENDELVAADNTYQRQHITANKKENPILNTSNNNDAKNSQPNTRTVRRKSLTKLDDTINKWEDKKQEECSPGLTKKEITHCGNVTTSESSSIPSSKSSSSNPSSISKSLKRSSTKEDDMNMMSLDHIKSATINKSTVDLSNRSAANLLNNNSSSSSTNGQKISSEINDISDVSKMCLVINDKPSTTTTTTTRMQFNIPPPPRQVSSSKSSVVDYAKSKIYDSPKHPNNINKASLNAIPAIVSTFKPPKVDVSKARERWEGGEPFILANIRRQRNFGKKNLLSTWSVTSVVSSKQNQFQNSVVTKNNSSANIQQNFTKSSVKQLLASGSVLERVQQFEKSPPEDISVALFKTTTKDDELLNDVDGSLNRQKEISHGANVGDIRETSKLASYKSKISLASTDAHRGGDDLLVNKSENILSSYRRASLRRQSSSSSNTTANKIPRFYHPDGKPNTYEIEIQIKNIASCFDKFPDRKAALFGPSRSRQFHAIALACGFSEYYKEPLYIYVCQKMKDSTTNNNGSIGTKKGLPLRKASSVDHFGSASDQSFQDQNQKFITCDQFLLCWRKVISSCYDAAARFVHLLTLGSRKYLIPEDFVPLLQSVIEDHPGLSFLRAAPDFHMRYIQTVVARIFFCINKSWTGKITLTELRRSNLLAVLTVLSEEDDINQITDYFSYEHFYVIYCKFWTLDQDHDLLISKDDLGRHNDAAISSRIIDRIFLGIVSKQVSKIGKMSYSEFVWFLIAEEDKKHPRSIEYWFRLMDLDGDGFISMYEMEYFYYEQMKRLELMGIEALPFQDCACQILDLVNPKTPNKITLSDLKRSRMTPVFFDTFIDLEKYLEHESREFASTRDVTQDGVVISDWDRYASEEYELLVSEESTTTTTTPTTTSTSI